jgi:hypothetical protein
MSTISNLNKDALYIAFPDSNGRLVNEYIPNDTGWIIVWLKDKIYELYIRQGVDINYWNIRHMLHPEMRK